jgi:hypothetical protein
VGVGWRLGPVEVLVSVFVKYHRNCTRPDSSQARGAE